VRETRDEGLKGGTTRIVAQMPVETRVVVPLVPRGQLRAHEHELLPRTREHVREQKAQVGEPLPFVTRHLAEQRSLQMHDLVV
jgi:hypothetical protein